MCHSRPFWLISELRTSGIGDHGREGLQDFISSHNCSHICLALKLASSEMLQITLDKNLEAGGEGGPEEAQENSSDEE